MAKIGEMTLFAKWEKRFVKIAGGERGVFHGIYQDTDEDSDPCPVALVEIKDGTVKKVEPTSIRFVDSLWVDDDDDPPPIF